MSLFDDQLDGFRRRNINEDGFDKDWDQMQKAFDRTSETVNRGFKAMLVLWVLGFIAVVSFWVGIAYVALHFIFKLW